MTPASGLWMAFLAIWGLSLGWTGAVSETAVPAIAAALAVLYLVSLVVLPGPTKLSRGGVAFIVALSALFLIQLLPLAALVNPAAASWRRVHGVGALWPATADAFYTVRTLAQFSAYLLAGLLVIRLRQAGVSTSQMILGIVAVLLVEAAYGMVQAFADLRDVPFYGPRAAPDSASGTIVSRNNFGGLMAIGLVIAAVRAYGRFAWPTRAGADPGRPRWMRRVESGAGWALAAAVFVVALVLSKSRGGTLCALGGLLLLPFFYRGRASLAGAAALVGLGVVAVFLANPAGLFERFGTIDPFELTGEMRWTIFTTTLQAAGHQPLLGFGWGAHPRAYHPYQPASLAGQIHHAHNEYVNVFFEAGAIGVALLLAGLGYWFARAWRAQKPLSGPDRIPVTAALGAAAVVALHSGVDFDLRITAIGIAWAALLGLGAAASKDGAGRTTWPVAAGALAAAAALAFLGLNPDRVADRVLTSAPDGSTRARLDRALALSPFDHRTAWLRARLTGDPAGYEAAADLFPAHPDLQREAGLTFWDNGDQGRAGKCLRRLFEQDPVAVAGVMDEIDVKGVASAELEALLPGTAGAWAVYAGTRVKRGLWKEGAEAFDRGVKAEAANAAWFDYFAARLEAAGQWGMEASVRERRLKLKSDAAAYGAAAAAWQKLGAYARALEQASMAAQIDPANARWPGLRASILCAQGDRRGAVEAFTAACARAPSELSWRLQRGLVELEEKTYVSAAEDFEEVLRSRPEERSAVLGLARAQAGQGRAPTARVRLDAWLARHPDDGEAAALRDSLPR